jgi:hypothetical protein
LSLRHGCRERDVLERVFILQRLGAVVQALSTFQTCTLVVLLWTVAHFADGLRHMSMLAALLLLCRLDGELYIWQKDSGWEIDLAGQRGRSVMRMGRSGAETDGCLLTSKRGKARPSQQAGATTCLVKLSLCCASDSTTQVANTKTKRHAYFETLFSISRHRYDAEAATPLTIMELQCR